MSVRRSLPLLLPRGRYSSMMDLGGVSAGEVKSKLDYGKNSKLRAVALDFDLITRSLDASRSLSEKEAARVEAETVVEDDTVATPPSPVLPNVGVIQDLAALFNVTLGGSIGGADEKKSHQDDLSALLSKEEEDAILRRKEEQQNPATYSATDRTAGSIKAPPVSNVRDKYAKKLRDKLESGGAVTPLGHAPIRGDAADHFAAKKLALSSDSGGSSSGSKWLASTECGTLLSFLMHRCMKIVLLPIPHSDNNTSSITHRNAEGARMDDLTKQLPKVDFHLVVKQPSSDDDERRHAEDLLSLTMRDLNATPPEEPTDAVVFRGDDDVLLPRHCLVVSDRDDYLRHAKEQGMFTCRVRPPNARRGNVTANYDVEEFGKVEDVVNEINGISFHTVFNTR